MNRRLGLNITTAQNGTVGLQEYSVIEVPAETPLRIFVFRGVPMSQFEELRRAFRQQGLEGLAINLPLMSTFEVFEEEPS